MVADKSSRRQFSCRLSAYKSSDSQGLQMALHFCALLATKAMEWLRHEIIANAQARQGALYALNNRRTVMAHLINPARQPDDLLMQRRHAFHFPSRSRFIEIDI